MTHDSCAAKCYKLATRPFDYESYYKPWHTPEWPDRAFSTCYIIAILLNITQVSHSPVLKKSNLGGTTVFTQNNIIIIFVDVLFLNNWIFWVKTSRYNAHFYEYTYCIISIKFFHNYKASKLYYSKTYSSITGSKDILMQVGHSDFLMIYTSLKVTSQK